MFISAVTASIPHGTPLDRMRWAADHGFQALDLSCYPWPPVYGSLSARTLSKEQRRDLVDATRSFKRIDLHAPFIDFNLVSPNPAIRDLSFHEIRAAMELGSELGANTITVHTGRAHAMMSPEEEREHVVAGLERLVEEATKLGVVVGVEVADYFGPVERFDLLERFPVTAIGVTLDVGHIAMTGDRWCDPRRFPPDVAARLAQPGFAPFGTIGGFIRYLGQRLVHVHIHDFAQGVDHLPIGEGQLDFNDLFAALRDTGYRGALSLEINIHRPLSDTLASKAKLESYLDPI